MLKDITEKPEEIENCILKLLVLMKKQYIDKLKKLDNKV